LNSDCIYYLSSLSLLLKKFLWIIDYWGTWGDAPGLPHIVYAYAKKTDFMRPFPSVLQR